MSGLHDFAFQTGTWKVRHKKLRKRLAGSTDWYEFDGTCRAWELLGGAGNVDDHWLEDPQGAYAAATIRKRDPAMGRWSIWWVDPRFEEIEPSVSGGFENGVGRFEGRDTLAGKQIMVRFIWSGITKNEAKWEQAFSPDEGASWETNWVMDFTRTG
jgi:hypothetical protein